MLTVFLAALIISVAIQGRLLTLQSRRISALEATTRRFNQQSVQMVNVMIEDQQARVGELSDLRREIEAIRQVANASTVDKAAGPSTPSASTPIGEWVLEKVERGGNLVNSGVKAAKVGVFVEGDAYRAEEDGKVISRWTISFDHSKDPREFDATIENGKFKGQVYRGIYRIEGDRWTYCNGPPGGGRPSKFSAPAGSDTTMVVAKRKGTP